MNRYLIIGGNSVAGQAVLDALRKHDPAGAVTATSSGDSPVAGAGETIGGIDLSNPGSLEKIPEAGYRMLFFTPAFGPIGYPIAVTPASDVKQALDFSYHPMVALSSRLKPELTVGFTAFYWLPHTLTAYGSMAYVKIAQELLAIENPAQFRMIRAGSFVSKATRGIGLLLQRALRDTPHKPIQELGEKWKQSGMKFGDFFFQYACDSEKAAFSGRFPSAHRQTNQADIARAVGLLLSGESAPIINVIGDWVWTDSAPQPLPGDFRLDVKYLLAGP